jgi:hypothetical protein
MYAKWTSDEAYVMGLLLAFGLLAVLACLWATSPAPVLA